MIPFYKGKLDGFINKDLEEVIGSGIATNYGKYFNKLKNTIEDYLNPNHVTLVASGTHALTLSLLALKDFGRLPENARILLPSFTFIASAQAILLANMKPVFADIDPETWTIKLDNVHESFDAIMPVNIFGVQPDIEKTFISVQDLSHGFGGSANGIKNGTQGTIAAFSTSITKPFHTVEGGIVTSKDKELVDYIHSSTRWHLTEDYDCVGVGQWSKLSELHALAGLSSFDNLETSITYKTKLAEEYRSQLNTSEIQFQRIPDNCISTYKDFGILVPKNKRVKIINALKENEIGYKLYFSPAVTETSFFKKEYGRCYLPVTQDISSRILCLPIHQDITFDDIEHISNIIKKCL